MMTCSKGTLAISATKKEHIPTGGVKRPIIKFKVRMTPKWTISISYIFKAGRKTGIRTTIAAIVSMKQPTIKQQDIDDQQDDVLIGADRHQKIPKLLGDLFIGQYPSEKKGCAAQKADHPDGPGHLGDILKNALRGRFFVDE